MAEGCGRVKWLYQGRRVNSQTAGGGGALRTNISVPAGVTASLVSMTVTGAASAGAGLTVNKMDEDGAVSLKMGYAAAGASRVLSFPSPGTTANAHGNYPSTEGLILGPGETIATFGDAALNTETHTVAIVLLMSAPVEPTWATTGSAGTPSLAASTISAANTLQAVVC